MWILQEGTGRKAIGSRWLQLIKLSGKIHMDLQFQANVLLPCAFHRKINCKIITAFCGKIYHIRIGSSHYHLQWTMIFPSRQIFIYFFFNAYIEADKLRCWDLGWGGGEKSIGLCLSDVHPTGLLSMMRHDATPPSFAGKFFEILSLRQATSLEREYFS